MSEPRDRLRVPGQRPDDVSDLIPAHEDPLTGTYVFLCPWCGQPGEAGQRCNSGIHQGPSVIPDPDGPGPLMVPSYELAGGRGGVHTIARERRRQIEDEGFDLEHDASERGLVDAAVCYLTSSDPDHVPVEWPWDGEWWKPGDTISNLTKAGALIAAELDRRLRNSG